jgi:hypothetical protein
LRPPVGGVPVRGFDPAAGSGPFGPGHTGVDFAARAGTAVAAPAAGTVSFAGRVAGATWVTIQVGTGVLVTIGPLDPVTVHVGQRVGPGFVVGRVGTGHDDALHLGLRVDTVYTDPLPHLARAGPARLVPLPGADPASITATLDPGAAGQSGPGPVPSGEPGPGPGRPGGTPPSPVARRRAAAGLVRSVARVVGGQAVSAIAKVRQLAGRPGPAAIAASAPAGGGGKAWFAPVLIGAPIPGVGTLPGLLWDWACGPGRAVAAAAPPNGNLVVGVAGIASSTGSARELDLAGLGYRDADIAYYSYRGLAGPGAGDPAAAAAYNPEDTLGSLRAAGQRLYDQLAALHARSPGRGVDIVAHSQGGIVAAYFMAYLYDPADPFMPRIDHVVTLASPHRGADLATTVSHLRTTGRGRRLLGVIEPVARLFGVEIRSDSVAVGQLAEDSELMRQLNERAIARATAIRGGFDVVVTNPQAGRSDLPGRSSCATHGGILRDERARRAVLAALRDEPLPLPGPGGDSIPAVVGGALHRGEDALGAALERWAGWSPLEAAPAGAAP